MPRRGTAGSSPWYAFVSFLRVKKGNARRGTACPKRVSRAPKGYRVPQKGIVCPKRVRAKKVKNSLLRELLSLFIFINFL